MKNILVSGGTRGLGLAIAERLLQQGYRVVATGRQISDRLKRLIDTHGEGAIYFERLDLSDSSGISFALTRIVERHGELYGLVNNAAVGHDGVLATMHDSEIVELMAINVLGTILLTKYASRSMLLQREGRIINVSSIIAHTGFSGLSVYAASKSALIGFSKSLARELGKANITVNSISPGFMETEMTSTLSSDKRESIRRRSPLGRLVGVEEVADAIEYLLSEKARSVTGTDLVIDAGSTT